MSNQTEPLPDWERRVIEAADRHSRVADLVREALVLRDDASAPIDEVVRSLSAGVEGIYEPVIDRYDTALIEAARGELELISDGLDGDQEIRARALDAAGRVMASAAHPDADRALIAARKFEAYIRGDAQQASGGTNG